MTQPFNQAKGTAIRRASRAGLVMLVLDVLLVAANLRAPITGLSPLIDDIRQATGIGNALAGLLTTLPLLAFAVFSLIAPKLARRIGIERTLYMGLILIAFGLIFRFLAPVWMLFVGTVFAGVGIAMGNVLLPGLIKRDFPDNVGIMMGAYAVVMNGIAALASGISVPLADELGLGWHGALSIWLLLTVVTLLIWIPQLRLQHKPSASASLNGKGMWRSSLAWQVTFFMGLQSLMFYTMIAWLPSILKVEGFSESTAGWLLSLMQFVSLPTSFLTPIIAGRFKGQRSLVTVIEIGLLISFLGLLIGNTWVSVISVLIFGFVGGASFSLATMFFVLRTKTSHQSAELSGMAQSIGYLLAAIGPTLIGLIHDITTSWSVPLILLVITAILFWLAGMGSGKNTYVE
ncbi:MFS transporter [Pullulanibacillus sp. KACC 23026]|uniref:CynX/NimT family MFS transporter n=1 Tax=Pullulanibacillus sp. KACC 23026 TaxID=3028315 RepID=UPI0023B1D67F|nr:MFS transporter [Pullulanibacillus sp. KACC 23026]WEG13261.1 MFS transporter [Pullulanibacillus sp. KACC 23026]